MAAHEAFWASVGASGFLGGRVLAPVSVGSVRALEALWESDSPSCYDYINMHNFVDKHPNLHRCV